MNQPGNEQQIQKSLRRHITVSAIAFVSILALVLLDLSPFVVVTASIVIAVAMAGATMHVFSERVSIQLLFGFTAFFVFMLLSWSHEGLKDVIYGTTPGAYDTAAPVTTEASH